MERLNIDNILNVDELNSEFEFEQATSLQGRLRWMVKENPSLGKVRQHLINLIEKYETENWEEENSITDDQIKESDIAERLVNAESLFIQKRKELIKEKLRDNQITQKDLGKLLGHRPNYMSELINGIRPFSKDDIVVIHRLFDIDFKDLIPPFLKKETTNRIKITLEKFGNMNMKLKIKDLESA